MDPTLLRMESTVKLQVARPERQDRNPVQRYVTPDDFPMRSCITVSFPSTAADYITSPRLVGPAKPLPTKKQGLQRLLLEKLPRQPLNHVVNVFNEKRRPMEEFLKKLMLAVMVKSLPGELHAKDPLRTAHPVRLPPMLPIFLLSIQMIRYGKCFFSFAVSCS